MNHLGSWSVLLWRRDDSLVGPDSCSRVAWESSQVRGIELRQRRRVSVSRTMKVFRACDFLALGHRFGFAMDAWWLASLHNFILMFAFPPVCFVQLILFLLRSPGARSFVIGLECEALFRRAKMSFAGELLVSEEIDIPGALVTRFAFSWRGGEGGLHELRIASLAPHERICPVFPCPFFCLVCFFHLYTFLFLYSF